DLLFMIEENERRYDEHQGLLLGCVTTAVPLSDEQRIQLEKKVAKTMNYQSVELKQIVDSSIIGGAIVEANHRVIDGSIRTQLENMRNQLN
ncbi:ATP synthase F1 subunit delta, partial [Enterococcus faecium]|uniref:ATP synthase F1 subunit delta n=1 Tax=Enterococcus faecium TaxID=1352 RepID=UPI003CC68A1F